MDCRVKPGNDDRNGSTLSENALICTMRQAKAAAFNGLFPPSWSASIAFDGVLEAEHQISPHRVATRTEIGELAPAAGLIWIAYMNYRKQT